jgi:hypothetical protein
MKFYNRQNYSEKQTNQPRILLPRGLGADNEGYLELSRARERLYIMTGAWVI